MIRINLLPEEYRKKSRTPIKMLVAMGLVVALNAGLMSWWGWTVLGIRAKIESERATLQLEMDGLTPQVTYFHALETESKQYKVREKTLSSITSNRISWTRKLDELIDVANAGGDGSRHLVWLDDLTVTQTADPNNKNFGSVRASGHSGSEKFAQVANFLEDLEISAFVDDFEKPSPPEGTQTLVDETLVPPVAWAFPLSLSLKGPEERVKSAGERLKKAATPTPEGDKGANGADGKKPAPEKAGTDAGAKSATPEPPAKPQANPPTNPPTTPPTNPPQTPENSSGTKPAGNPGDAVKPPATPGGNGTSTQEEPR
jgi:hypothetical protein